MQLPTSLMPFDVSLILIVLTALAAAILLIDKLITARVGRDETDATTPVLVDYAQSLLPILTAVLLLRSFLFEPFQIPTPSMVPTLNVGDFILVNKFAYGLRLPLLGTRILDMGEPQRGDVMVFIPPHDPHYYVKRVIGLPGDHVRSVNNVVYLNDEALPAAAYQWLDADGVLRDPWIQPEGMVIPADQYFMMGDNRNNSEDSRHWGPASGSRIVGKAVAVWMHKESGWHLPTFAHNRLIEHER